MIHCHPTAGSPHCWVTTLLGHPTAGRQWLHLSREATFVHNWLLKTPENLCVSRTPPPLTPSKQCSSWPRCFGNRHTHTQTLHITLTEWLKRGGAWREVVSLALSQCSWRWSHTGEGHTGRMSQSFPSWPQPSIIRETNCLNGSMAGDAAACHWPACFCSRSLSIQPRVHSSCHSLSLSHSLYRDLQALAKFDTRQHWNALMRQVVIIACVYRNVKAQRGTGHIYMFHAMPRLPSLARSWQGQAALPLSSLGTSLNFCSQHLNVF